MDALWHGVWLAALFVGPGAAMMLLLGTRTSLWKAELTWGELALASVGGSAVLGGAVALLLAQLGVFSLVKHTAVMALIALGCLAGARLRSAAELTLTSRPSRLRAAAYVAGLAVAAVWLVFFGRPFLWIIGGDDAGTYVNTAAHIASTGEITVHDSVTKLVSEGFEGVFFYEPDEIDDPLYARLDFPLQFVGFFITDPQSGTVSPQSLHMLPAVLAVWVSATGLPGALWLFPILALFGVGAVYHATRRTIGTIEAALAAGFLHFGFLQQWFARYPTSEMLVQPVFFFGLWLLAVAERTQSRALGAAAGFAFSFATLARGDAVLIVGAAVLYAVFSQAGRRRFWPHHLWLLAGMIPLVAQMLLHVSTVGRAYLVYAATYNVILDRFFEGDALVTASLVLFWSAFVGLAGVTALAVWKWESIGPGLGRWVEGKKGMLTWGYLALTTGLFFYAWLLRPFVLEPAVGRDAPLHPDGLSVVKLSWYLGVSGLVLAALGHIVLVRKARGAARLLILCGAITAAIYLYNPVQFALQPQWARKLMPIVVPFFAVCMATAVAWFGRFVDGRYRGWGRFAAGAIAAIQVGLMFQPAMPFLRYVEYAGVYRNLEGLNALIKRDDAVVLMHPGDIGFRFGPPLRYIFDRRVLLVQPEADEGRLLRGLERLCDQGFSPYFVSPEQAPARALPLTYQKQVRLELPETERPIDRPPEKITEAVFSLDVYTLDCKKLTKSR